MKKATLSGASPSVEDTEGGLSIVYSYRKLFKAGKVGFVSTNYYYYAH